MQAVASAFSGGKYATMRRGRVDIGADSAHRIMDDGAHGDGCNGWFDADIRPRQFANLWQTLVELRPP